MTAMSRVREAIREAPIAPATGVVARSIGLMIESLGPPARIGEKCFIHADNGREPIVCEVVGFNNERLLLMPFEQVQDIGAGSRVESVGGQMTVPVGEAMLGRVLGGLGEPIDSLGPLSCDGAYPVNGDPPHALSRNKISKIMPLGVRAIDGLLTCGVGQRMGIFAGPGVGKSTLLGMIARNTQADVNVIGLIGERGREVGEFIQRDLGPEGLKRSVVVVVTSDQPPVLRMRGAQVATAVAEYFRDTGRDVLLLMDSITRFAWAQREVGLATGEPPTRNGYTPSVFAALPRLLERAGNSAKGSITGLYTVLVDGDDMDEPVSSAVRATLDGHIVLSRRLAGMGHYPAIDILDSVSRVMPEICSREHQLMAQEIRAAIAAYRENEDLINLGAYVSGANPLVDRAIALKNPIDVLLRQSGQDAAGLEDTIAGIEEILSIPQPTPGGPNVNHPARADEAESGKPQPAAGRRADTPYAPPVASEQFSTLGT